MTWKELKESRIEGLFLFLFGVAGDDSASVYFGVVMMVTMMVAAVALTQVFRSLVCVGSFSGSAAPRALQLCSTSVIIMTRRVIKRDYIKCKCSNVCLLSHALCALNFSVSRPTYQRGNNLLIYVCET